MRTNKFVKKNYVNELLAIIKGNFTENELKKKIANYHEKDIADALTHLTEQERWARLMLPHSIKRMCSR